MTTRTKVILATAAGTAVAIGSVTLFHGKTAALRAPDPTTVAEGTTAPSPPADSTATAPATPQPRPAIFQPSPMPSLKVLKPPRPPEYTEDALMTKLRDLSGTDPALSLRLAREGNVRFKDSPDAAERAWIVVKSLVNMNRNDEARIEGAAVIQKYQGTSWANDIHRHMFVNPPTDPSERGYGKKTELEGNPK